LPIHCRLNGPRQHTHELPPMPAQAIKSARLDEAFDRGPADYFQINSLAEIEKILERTSSLRARTISSDELQPTPLMAVRPKTILPLWTVNSLSLTLTSGDSTSTPILRASAIWSTMMSRLLASSISLDRSAAMNSGL